MSSETWGHGYIDRASKWEGLISWVNWVIETFHQEDERGLHFGVLLEIVGEKKVTVSNVLACLSSPFFLVYLLELHPAFVSLSPQTMLELEPQNVDNHTSPKQGSTGETRMPAKHPKYPLDSEIDNKEKSRERTPAKKFLNLKAQQSFLLTHALSFIQLEVPCSRVR